MLFVSDVAGLPWFDMSIDDSSERSPKLTLYLRLAFEKQIGSIELCSPLQNSRLSKGLKATHSSRIRENAASEA